jgi:hypothetical protein
MSTAPYDFAIVGTTPQARLIAGLLATTHGKRVALQGESQSSYRLARGVDLSVGAITRPQTWSLLALLLPETLKLIGKAGGRRGWSRIDPILFADGRRHKEALSHVRQMASAFGIAAERLPQRDLGQDRDGIVLRDAVLLHRPQLERALDKWLENSGVIRIDDSADLELAADGSSAATGPAPMQFAQTVLVGDAALTRYLPEGAWPETLVAEQNTTILTEPTPAISAPVMHQLDRRLTMLQPAERGISAIGPGGTDAFTSGLRDLLGSQRPFRQAGQSSYWRAVSRDGAPLVGRLGGVGADVVAGFGMPGAFFAPALARWLCGAATPVERDWLEARLVGRAVATSTVAEAEGAA